VDQDVAENQLGVEQVEDLFDQGAETGWSSFSI
jgi:hypothetical protein